jgi:hypothetical protein
VTLSKGSAWEGRAEGEGRGIIIFLMSLHSSAPSLPPPHSRQSRLAKEDLRFVRSPLLQVHLFGRRCHECPRRMERGSNMARILLIDCAEGGFLGRSSRCLCISDSVLFCRALPILLFREAQARKHQIPCSPHTTGCNWHGLHVGSYHNRLVVRGKSLCRPAHSLGEGEKLFRFQ